MYPFNASLASSMIARKNCVTNKTHIGSCFMLCFLACNDKLNTKLKDLLDRIILEGKAPLGPLAPVYTLVERGT